ncbi:MAG: disulfide bond formation protein B [Burkholderiales bacterium]|nr:disulfide bond formation protein B [Burkholderiales bacterium]
MPARIVFLLIFLACSGLLAFGLYLQHMVGLEPCPLCIFQRYAFVLTGLIALVAFIHGPGRTAQAVYGALTLLVAGGGAAIAGRQTWLQHNPPNIFECGPDLGYILDAFPLTKAVPMIFKGEGDCAEAGWTFAGLSIAEWALAWFAAFLIAGLYVVLVRPRRSVFRV